MGMSAASSHGAITSAQAARSETKPRKVLIGTMMHYFGTEGDLDKRLEKAANLIDEIAQAAATQSPGKKLDIIAMPEHAIANGNENDADSKCVALEGKVLQVLGKKAKEYGTYIVLTMWLKETNANHTVTFSNAAILLDRQGKVAGIYRKVHPCDFPDEPDSRLEGGVRAGDAFPVFDCDFGKVGFQICWDVMYGDGWTALGKNGAEIVFFCTASPQTVRPASYALNNRYYVVSSTPRNNASFFNPLGMLAAQITDADKKDVLVHEIDLSYSLMGWAPRLLDGKAMTDHFGDKVGFLYSDREDGGLFWSNDPDRSIASMLREMKLDSWSFDARVQESLKLRAEAHASTKQTHP